MKRGKAAAGQRTNGVRRKAAAKARPRRPAAARNGAVAELKRALAEALEQQTATSNVLEVISRSAFDLQAVFDTVAESSARLCGADRALITRFDGEVLQYATAFNAPAEAIEYIRRNPFRLDTHSATGRAALERRAFHVPDAAADPEITTGARDAASVRTVLGVPILKGDDLLGVITIYRTEVRPFTDKQIALVETFADQAAIAIENVRLFEAEQQRTRELGESLEQQTAMSEVLDVISRSAFDLDAVFATVVERSARLSGVEGARANIFRFDGELLRLAATFNVPPTVREWLEQHPQRPGRHSGSGRAALERRTIHVPDILADPEYSFGVKALESYRTILAVPIIKADDLLGVILIYLLEVKPFTAKQIALVETFADQAAIAIENVRLFETEQQRTRELTESLEQQTATSEVLKVISSSPGELKPVFETMLRNAVRICGATFGNLWLREGDVVRIGATHGAPTAWSDFLRREPVFRADPRFGIGQLIRTKQTYHVADLTAEPTRQDKLRSATIELTGARTLIGVPMLKDSEVIGCIVIYRQEVRPFTDKQIELVENFAAQAVIAIENARLLSELRESLQRQTATSNILGAIAASPTDADGALREIAETTARLFGAVGVSFRIAKGDEFKISVGVGQGAEQIGSQLYDDPARRPTVSGRNLPGTVVRENRQIHIPDLGRLAGEQAEWPGLLVAREVGIRTMVGTPLRIKGSAIGALMVYRNVLQPFEAVELQLLQTFADQAVIAIENARLFEAEQQRTRELTESLEQQTATSEVLRVISSSPGDLAPVFETILANATRLCEASFGILFLTEGDGFRVVAWHNTPADFIEAQLARMPVVGGRSNTTLGRVAATKRPAQSDDIWNDPAYTAAPERLAILKLAGARTMLCVPMLKDEALVGQIAIYRTEVRPFADKQIDIVANFAAQAVIAIENARLLSELRESLQQQTATADVLRVISSSPGELQPVFEAMLENAVRICGASFGSMFLFEGEHLRRVALHNAPASYAEYAAQNPVIHYSVSGVITRLRNTRRPEQTPDLLSDDRNDPLAKFAGARTVVTMPMLKHDELIGIIAIYRREVRPFTDKQVELLTNFAAQAVIAIENARLLSELRQRTDDLSESLEQQTATAEVLQVISSSPGELQPVFDGILGKSVRICGADAASLFLYEDGTARVAARHSGVPQAVMPIAPSARSGTMRAIATKQIVHIPDYLADPAYREGDNYVVAAAERLGLRASLHVPMMKDQDVVGVITIWRKQGRAFTQKQIDLIANFAAQAVIAIENVRLFEAEQQRTKELTESLAQQTATSDVLQVISSSPGDLQPVFTSMLENAVRICDANWGTIYRAEGDSLRLVATHNTPTAFSELRGGSPLYRHHPQDLLGRLVASKDVVHFADCAAEEVYVKRLDPVYVAAVELGGVRTALAVPMLKDDELIGAFVVARQKVRAFTDKQIALLQNFAAQAVIAIENARLLSELRQSLERQTATADILRIISQSPTDARPAFEGIAVTAARLLRSDQVYVMLRDGDVFSNVAGATPQGPVAKDSLPKNVPIDAGANFPSRAIIERKTLYLPDWSLIDLPEHEMRIQGQFGVKSALYVPLLRERECIGLLTLVGTTPNLFGPAEIAQAESFRDQALIAIENTRLFNELRQRTDQLGRSVGELRALGEVSQAVNSTLDLENVLETIVAKAVQLSSTDAGAIYVFDDTQDDFHLRATYGMDQGLIDALSHARINAGDRNIATLLAEREPVQNADLSQGEITEVDRIILRAGYRSRLTVPLIRGDDIVGMLVVRRRTPGSFPQNTVDLIKTFAAQSAVAIQNARLYASVEMRTRELAASLADLRTAQDRLIQTEKLASLGQLTAGIAHEIKNPLNFVNNFSSLSAELIDELQQIMTDVAVADDKRAEVAELTGMLRGNLEKVVQHGKRADSIVKNMLLHSRQGSGEHQLADVNAIVEESLNLAYHGARAEKQGFNITLQRSFDPDAGKVDLFPQEITRVLLNLISNGFYAATKRKAEGNGGDYEPTLSAATRNLGDSVEIRIRDNGTGIPPEVREKMFNPFFTTKPAGEGTGLGLSLSYDIIVKQHSGSIEVDTKPGEFTEFRIVLPRGSAGIAKAGGNA